MSESYSVLIIGSLYDELYYNLAYVGSCIKTAQIVIEEKKGTRLQNGGVVYAYLETWVSGSKTNSREFEL